MNDLITVNHQPLDPIGDCFIQCFGQPDEIPKSGPNRRWRWSLLTQHFPDEYQLYRSRTKALIPFIL